MNQVSKTLGLKIKSVHVASGTPTPERKMVIIAVANAGKNGREDMTEKIIFECGCEIKCDMGTSYFGHTCEKHYAQIKEEMGWV